MGKGFKTNLIIIILLILTAGVITLGISNDKKARAKDLQDVQEYENKSAATIKQNKDNADKKSKDEAAEQLDVYGKLQAGKDIKILVVGDSVGKSIGKSTDDAAWDLRLKKMIDDKYKVNSTIQNISEESAVAYKGYYDVMKDDLKDFDIAIVSLGGTDQYISTKEQFSSTYEAVIRQLKKKNSKAEIIPVLENTMKSAGFVDIIKDVSNNYNLNLVDMITAYNDTDLNQNDLLKDKDHPNDKGYGVYADAIFKVIDKNVADKKVVAKELKNSKDTNADTFDKFNLVTKYDVNDGFDEKDGIMVNNKDGADLDFKTSASVVGLSYLDTKGGGYIKIYVNDKFVKIIDTNSDSDVKKAKVIADNLKGENTIKIRAQNKTVKIFGAATN